MEAIIQTTLIGLFFGTFGTTLGGILGITMKGIRNKTIGFILSLAAGLMTGVVSFDLIPEAMEIAGIVQVIVGIVAGIIAMIICDVLVHKKFSTMPSENNSLLKTGMIISIGLALHNLPEGLAIGSGFEASLVLGYSLAIAIALHDIPEGISMAVPMKQGGMPASKILLYVFLSGVTTGIGAFVGAVIGGISENIIAMCLAFAAGAMLYIVSGELVPESHSVYKGKMNAIGNILGFILGLYTTIL